MPVRIVRVIARLNVGGPALQAIALTQRLRGLGYDTVLVRGQEGEYEGNVDDLAAAVGVQPVLLEPMRRDPGLHDVAALFGLLRIIRRQRPALVHTHAAKAGTLGRVAALLAGMGTARRPVLVHTFHGHSLIGYFSPRVAAFYRFVERVLARYTDRLIAVSEEVRDDLVALGVAPREKFVVIPLGLDLSGFTIDDEARACRRARVRAELGIGDDEMVVTLIARLVPIKRVDRFLRVCTALAEISRLRFLVVGDGELGEELRGCADTVALRDRLVWTGMRRDIPDICFASDIVTLCSDQEGTPVSLIEAAAAGLPAVSTEVGGAAKVIDHGRTGFLVGRDDDVAFAEAIRKLVLDRDLRAAMGAAGCRHVSTTFALERLVADVDGLYRQLLDSRS